MAQITGSVVLTGYISPSDTTDTYATHYSLYQKGGVKAVLNYSDIAAIQRQRLQSGSLIYVINQDKYYKFNNNTTLS